jgi:hypothetical protein
MCWSPNADLVAGGVVAALGVVSFGRTVRAGRARDLALAALPLVLGAHQLLESAVWSGWDDGTTGGWAVTAWAVIAFPLLPAFVPLAVALAAGRGRRLRFAPFVAVGLAVSAVFAYAVAGGPVTAEAVGHTMRYGIHALPAGWLVVAGYLFATLGALFVSNYPDIRLLGTVAFIGVVVCGILWRYAFASTWCALAAVASLVVVKWTWRGGSRRRAGGGAGSWRARRAAS